MRSCSTTLNRQSTFSFRLCSTFFFIDITSPSLERFEVNRYDAILEFTPPPSSSPPSPSSSFLLRQRCYSGLLFFISISLLFSILPDHTFSPFLILFVKRTLLHVLPLLTMLPLIVLLLAIVPLFLEPPFMCTRKEADWTFVRKQERSGLVVRGFARRIKENVGESDLGTPRALGNPPLQSTGRASCCHNLIIYWLASKLLEIE